MTRFIAIEGLAHATQETLAFADHVSSTDLFTEAEPVFVTRAPGRLDVMGGIADYSGSLVLQLPIADATYVALQKSDSTTFRISSESQQAPPRFIEVHVANIGTCEYETARRLFAKEDRHWAAYIVGVCLVLMREKGVRFTRSANLLIKSTVPEGKGVASSAALEVAVMKAVTSAFDIKMDCRELATLCQKAENLIAGAPCGIMDQMTSACGEENRLLELLCQPDQMLGTLRIPEELQFWGIDSGVRHAVSGSDYTTVRTAAFMGYRILADVAALSVSPKESGKVSIDDTKWKGYLANITPAEFEENYLRALPGTVRGDEFLSRYHGITDTVTSVQPDINYPVKQSTSHAVYENARVQSFSKHLKDWQGIGQARELGKLMFESHQSYSDCGLGSEATDLIVDLVRDSVDDGLFGARITGGGSGGTVAVLARSSARAAIERLRKKFAEQTGYNPIIISGSSPGARAFDHVTLKSHGVARL
jgi:L-arabinokinase